MANSGKHAQEKASSGKKAAAALVALLAVAAVAVGALFATGALGPSDTASANTKAQSTASTSSTSKSSSGSKHSKSSSAADKAKKEQEEKEAAEAKAREEEEAAAAAEAALRDPEGFYVLIVGNDTRDGTVYEGTGGHGADGHARSDTQLLVRVDPTKHRIGLLTVPRDTQAVLDGQSTKINDAYDRAGIGGTVAEIEKLTGVSIRYYLNMTMAHFTEFINGIGGMQVNVPIDLDPTDFMRGGKLHLYPGDQWLDGYQTLGLVQNRMQYGGPLPDMSRQIQTRQVVQRLIERFAALPDNEIDGHVNLLMSLVESNMPAEELSRLAKDFAAHRDEIVFLSGTGRSDGDFDPDSGLWLAIRDEATWHTIIDTVEKGGDPQTIVGLLPVIPNY